MSITTIALLALGPVCLAIGWVWGWGVGKAKNADLIGEQRERINALELQQKALGDQIRALAAAPPEPGDVERLLRLVSANGDPDAA